MAETDLQKRLEKLGEQLVTDIEAWEKRTREDRAKVLDQLTHTIEGKLSEAFGKIAEASAKHQEREEQRKRNREEKRRRHQTQQESTAGGVVFLVSAVICAVMGVMNPQLWWLVFVALGLGLAGAGQVARDLRRDGTRAPRRGSLHRPHH